MGVQKKTRKFAEVCILIDKPRKSCPNFNISTTMKMGRANVKSTSNADQNTQQVKRVIGRRDARLKENKLKAELAQKEKEKKTINGELIREAPQMPSNMFFQHNTALVPPYNVLVDTNFLSHSVQRKLSLLDSMMDCLYAKCNPIITSCVVSLQLQA